MEEEKNRDIDLMKIQIYTEHCHAILTAFLGFDFAFIIGFSVLFFPLPVFSLERNFGYLLVYVFGFGLMIRILRDYQKHLKTISRMTELVKKDIELPKLEKITDKEIERIWNAQK